MFVGPLTRFQVSRQLTKGFAVPTSETSTPLDRLLFLTFRALGVMKEKAGVNEDGHLIGSEVKYSQGTNTVLFIQ